jgi:hypothetical protein
VRPHLPLEVIAASPKTPIQSNRLSQTLNWLCAMGPSQQVSRRSSRKDLGKRLKEVKQEGLDSHNQQVLWEACSSKHLVTKFWANFSSTVWTREQRVVRPQRRIYSQEVRNGLGQSCLRSQGWCHGSYFYMEDYLYSRTTAKIRKISRCTIVLTDARGSVFQRILGC